MLENPGYKNLVYHNNGDRVYIDMQGARLTEGGEELKKLYSGKYNRTGTEYTITFPSELADIGSGLLKINDGVLDSIQVSDNEANQTTSITFKAKSKFTYLVFYRPDINNTAVTVLKPAASKDKLVVIDAGHGGRDSGAVYGSLKEKDLNLDIAIRLNKLLKNKKVKTFMTREDDSYVALYERAYMANSLNASLFLSVHNNAMDNPGYRGTMTLYFPQRASSGTFNGANFAQIVQSRLLGRLKTTDRKIIERPNLVVLKATAMPSALAEVAFMTNKYDRKNLQSAAFRQRAAQALCDAIIQSLSRIDRR
jgi:N-acetylmuramoyl-L-alanine amidase